MSKPMVSIIITNYNNKDYIKQAIESALAQEKPGIPIEVIVVDDCSTDGSVKLLESLQKKHGFKLKKNPRNLKLPAARNAGIKSAKGKYISFLDGDDYLLENKVKLQIEYLKEHKDVDIVYCDTYNEFAGEVDYEAPLSKQWPAKEGDIYEHLVQAGSIFGVHAALVPRDFFDKFLFNEELTEYSEDLELWLRIAASGAKFGFLNQPLVVYRRHLGQSRPRLEASLAIVRIYEKQLPYAKQKKLEKVLEKALAIHYRTLIARLVLAKRYDEARTAGEKLHELEPYRKVMGCLQLLLSARLNLLAYLFVLLFKRKFWIT